MPTPPRVALLLELELPFRRHTEIYAGVQRFAREHGWETVVDEYADDTLGRSCGGQPVTWQRPASGRSTSTVGSGGGVLPIRGLSPKSNPEV